MSYFILDERIHIYDIISTAWKSKKSYCIGISWEENFKIHPKVISGKNGNGIVYFSKIKLDKKLIDVAIKEGILIHDDRKNDNSSISEIFINKIITKNVIKNRFPFYPIIYTHFFCKDNCFLVPWKEFPGRLKAFKRQEKYSCFTYILEKWDGSMKDFYKIEENLSSEIELNILSQIIIILHYTHNILEIYHDSLRFDNILYKKIKSKGYWKFNYNGSPLFLKNMGYIICLNDFGNSIFLNKKYRKNMKESFKEKYLENVISNREKLFFEENTYILKRIININTLKHESIINELFFRDLENFKYPERILDKLLLHKTRSKKFLCDVNL
jgi:hypothetical protein